MENPSPNPWLLNSVNFGEHANKIADRKIVEIVFIFNLSFLYKLII